MHSNCWLKNSITNYMEQSAPYEANSRSSGQEITHLLRIAEVSHLNHKSHLLDPIMSRIKPVYLVMPHS